MAAKLNRIAVVMLAVVAVACIPSIKQGPKQSAETNTNEMPNIGLLEHRGRFYRIEDLMNPAYRAESNDPFVRKFVPDTNVAIPWAGTNNDQHPRKAKPDIWAGTNPDRLDE